MLTQPITSPGRIVAFADHDREDWHYVVAATPRLIGGAAGRPELQLLRWQSVSGDDETVGGRLNLGLTLEVDDEMLVEAEMTADKTGPIPWVEATIEVHGPGFRSAPAAVAMTSPERARVALDLDADAAVIMAALLNRDTASPIQIIWSGHVRMRMPDAEVTASASREEIVRRISQSRGAVSREVVRSMIEANVNIEISAGDNQELEQALRDFALDQLLKRFEDEDELVVSVGAADVVDWPVRLSAAIDDLGPVTPERVRTITLAEHELGRPPRLEVRVLGNFAGELDRVDVEIEQSDETTQLAFIDSHEQSIPIEPNPFRWRSRAKWNALPASNWSAWREAQASSSLLIPVSVQPSRAIEITAVGVAFGDRWKSVEVQLSAVASASLIRTVNLSAQQTTAYVELDASVAQTGFNSKQRFVSKTGLVAERRSQLAADQNLLLVRDPYTMGSLRTALVPTGNGWDEIAMMMVDLRYEDGDEHWEEARELSSRDDFAEWRIPVREHGPREFLWRYNASFADGNFQQSDWQRSESRLLTVPLDSPERRDLQILPIYLNDGESVELRLKIQGETKSVHLTDKSPQQIRLPAGAYQWQAVWRAVTGETTEGPLQDDDRDVIVIPRSVA